MQRGLWKGLIIVCAILLGLLGVSSLAVEPGSPTSIIIQIGAAHLLVAMGIMGAFLHFEWDPFVAFRN